MLISDGIWGNLFFGYENRYLNNKKHIIKRGKIGAGNLTIVVLF